ncbi:MAG: GTP cyclohydrolase I FolE2 [Candidatus Altiarchaeota archaeon]|nr:GTP cyclohydrolase I FolE2 [Candidatus Altiarchaeota archaeon]
MQDNKPRVQEDLERVGVTNLKTIVMTDWKGHKYNFVPRIELTIDLDRERRGAHMSRLIESITETIEEEIVIRRGSLEEVEKAILKKLKGKHHYRKAQVSMETDLVIPRKTPKTGKPSMETYGISVKVTHSEGVYGKVLTVKVLGNTVCPHALEQTMGKSHIQRAEAVLEMETAYENPVELEDMIDCVEGSFPSEIYGLLKTEDEIYVVNKMFDNPKFVEDVTRDILDRAGKRFKGCRIRVRTISQESIHRHDVIAEGSAET